jgi:hypothetical protein
MRRLALSTALLGSLLAFLALPASAASHIESVDGNLSADPSMPTSLTLDPGSNALEGGVSIPTGNDYLAITVPAGHALTGIDVTAFAGSQVAFLGLQAGSAWTAGEFFEIDASLLLGWIHFGASDIGGDILPAIGMGQGAQGFVPPLGAGDYTIVLQETGVLEVSYGFDLQVASVPEASLAGMLALGLLLPLLQRRRASA